MEQREVDNMLLSMIQKHFPSLPLSDEHTDWGKWLGFARAVYEAGRASPASVPAVTDGMALAFHRALTDGSIGQPEVDEIKTGLRAALAAAPTPSVSDERKDAPQEDYFADACRLALDLECLLLDCKDTAVTAKWWDSAHEALEQHRERIAAMQEDKP